MYFIYDCNGKVVGNPNGYRTFRGAQRQQDQRNSPAYRAIWNAFYEAEKTNPRQALVSSIKLVE